MFLFQKQVLSAKILLFRRYELTTTIIRKSHYINLFITGHGSQKNLEELQTILTNWGSGTKHSNYKNVVDKVTSKIKFSH